MPEIGNGCQGDTSSQQRWLRRWALCSIASRSIEVELYKLVVCTSFHYMPRVLKMQAQNLIFICGVFIFLWSDASYSFFCLRMIIVVILCYCIFDIYDLGAYMYDIYGAKSRVCVRLRRDIELRHLSMIETIKTLGIPQRGTKCIFAS